jgi:hypothetical protein
MARVRLLKPAIYARGEFDVGRVLEVDDQTAVVWQKNGIAVRTAESLGLWPTCLRCGVQWQIPETPTAGERWTACPNCKAGWMR